jgi:hypothetical protein
VTGGVRCPVCDAAGYACTGHVPIGSYSFTSTPTPRGEPMALEEYTVVINGYETTALLTAAQAKRLGAAPVAPPEPPPTEGTDAPTAGKTKQRKPANK